jgi:hypothetical protein
VCVCVCVCVRVLRVMWPRRNAWWAIEVACGRQKRKTEHNTYAITSVVDLETPALNEAQFVISK